MENSERDGNTRDQIANIHWIIEKAKEFQKNIYFCFIDFVKDFGCMDHNKLENSYTERNTRLPYMLPEKSVCGSRSNSMEQATAHEAVNWFQIGKGVHQCCIFSLCLFNLYAEYIM